MQYEPSLLFLKSLWPCIYNRLFSDTHFKSLVFVFNCGTQSQIYCEVGSSLGFSETFFFLSFYELLVIESWIRIHDTYVHWHVCGDQRIGTNVFPHCAPLLTSVFLILDSLINMARCTRGHCPSLCARSVRGYTDEGDAAWIYEGDSAGRQEWGVQTEHLELWKWRKLCAGFWRAGRSLEVRGQHWGILS